MILATDKGLYCEEGDFYIDPWRPVERAVITHAHSDHARAGSRSYLCARQSAGVMRYRIGPDISVQTVEYGETVRMNGVTISLHPAGHILGSAQVRIEHRGEVWVVSGDYKTLPDPTCEAFEVVRCNTFITESTFGLPIYRWTSSLHVLEQINSWWSKNAQEGKASLLLAYSLGKAQRVIHGVDNTIGPVYTHGATEAINEIYRASGVELPMTTRVSQLGKGTSLGGALVVAPQSVQRSGWLKRLGKHSTAFASGWMRIRGIRRRSALDRGFVLSDHADWPGLLDTINATGAEQILVTHGYSDVLVRYLREQGKQAFTMETRFQGESEEPEEALLADGEDRLKVDERTSDDGTTNSSMVAPITSEGDTPERGGTESQ
ncbi:MAG: ligase-associated DNA damage response exonuclease [Cyanobacteria bacterium]|nr:ligase-associated DNA damage response exonuclease [Cyanobacteriota bacterium]